MNLKGVIKKLIPRSLFNKIEPTGHLLEAMILHALAGFPARGFKVIGVTGTNGKTSTAFMIHRMLHEAGFKVGLMSTVAYGVGDNIQPQIHHMTNVSVPELIKRLKWMKSQGAEWLVLETTSHALAQHRVWGVPYSVAVMTNITHEHLAYHGTFERYLQAKIKLFTLTNNNKKGLQTGVINAEDPNAEQFAKAVSRPVTYGIKTGDITAKNIKPTSFGTEYTALIGDEEYIINCHLPGSFNISNSLAALAVGRAVGLTKQQIEQGIAALEGVEGRMTRIDEGQDFDVIVDYAHTPDSFEKLFKDLKPILKGKLIVVFGSLGGGDKGKRPLQGQLSGEYANEVILTQEDDRQEDPQLILNDIAEGVIKAGKVSGKNLHIIHDRTEAIKFAIKLAKPGDTVLLLGKGHEKTQEDATGEHPWNEISTAHDILKNLS